MNRLVFPLSEASQAGGHSFDEEVIEGVLRPDGVPETPLTKVRVTGSFTAIDTEFIFRGRLTGVFARPCDRCLEPARETVEQDVTWLFEPRDGAPDDAFRGESENDEGGLVEDDVERARYYDGDEIDLAPHVWEEMLLAAPSKVYCAPDCRGLCPGCGKNLNEGACDCAPETEAVRNSGLAALKDMFPNLPSKTVEE